VVNLIHSGKIRKGFISMEIDCVITLWTARVAMAFLAMTFALFLRVSPRERQTSLPRFFWTAGCAIFIVHVTAAFQFVHHWSNAHAVRVTAQQTPQRVIYGFMAFMAFNAAVVFAPSPSRWVGLSISIALLLLWVARFSQLKILTPANSALESPS
jgi:hypothetical protein